MKILLVEDDAKLRFALHDILAGNGYEVLECENGEEGLYALVNNACDLVVLDWMLPLLDGVDVLRRARAQGIGTPVLMLTAKNAIGDKVAGLDAGSDDYLAKPFDTQEFLARIRALARRPTSIENNEILRFGDIALSLLGLSLEGPAQAVRLSKNEGELLELFLRSAGNLLTRDTIFNRVWGPAADVEDGNIDNYIYLLRRRLQTSGSKVQIEALRGKGYVLHYYGDEFQKRGGQ